MKRRSLPLIMLFLLLQVLIGMASSVPRPEMPDPTNLVQGYCARIVDGDTAWFEIVDDGIPVTHTYRFIGVDTPETVHPDKSPEPGGKEAAAFTAATLLNQWVYLEYDVEKTDAYNRHLAYVWLEDGSLFNLTLLEKGMGRFMAIAPNVRYSAYFIAAQKAAQQAEAGVWSPLPEIALPIDLKSLSVDELYALQAMIGDELLLREGLK